MRRALLPFALAAACVLAFMLMGQAPSPTGAMELYSHGGGGGLDVGTADARYLKLDASNDPVTGNLEIDATGDTPRLTIEGKGPGAGAWACGVASVTPALAFSNSTHGMGISQGQGSGVDELVLCNQGARISIGENSAEFAFGNGIKPDGDDARVFGTWVDGSPGSGRRWLLNASRLLALKSGTAAAPSVAGADANNDSGLYYAATDQPAIASAGAQATRWSGNQTLVPDGSNVSPSFAFASSTMTGFALAAANTLGAYASGVTIWDAAAGVMNFTAQARLNVTGGASAPDLAFTNDSDTGLYRSAADTLAAATAGVLRWTSSASGFIFSTNARPVSDINYSLGSASFRWLESWAAQHLSSTGSAAAPGFTFDSDTNTGVYSSAGGSVDVSSDGTRMARFYQASPGEAYLALGTVAGSAATPSIHLTGDTDTGLGWYGANQMGVSTGGVQQVAFTTTGVEMPQYTSGTMTSLRVTSGVATTLPTKPSCSGAGDAGRAAVFDDTNDALPGAFCVCFASSGGTYAWRLPDAAGTACPL